MWGSPEERIAQRFVAHVSLLVAIMEDTALLAGLENVHGVVFRVVWKRASRWTQGKEITWASRMASL